MDAVIQPALKYKPNTACAMQKTRFSARRLLSQPPYEDAPSIKYKGMIPPYIVFVKHKFQYIVFLNNSISFIISLRLNSISSASDAEKLPLSNNVTLTRKW